MLWRPGITIIIFKIYHCLLKYWIPLLLVTLIAIAFRFPWLDSLPPGLNFDEAGDGMAALDVAQGHFRIWWPIGGGKEPFMAYAVQPLLWIFGTTPLALRLYGALMGVGAVLAIYFLARQLLPVEDNPDLALLPTIAALGLATAFWHVAYSRIAFRALASPLVEALALAFLWRGFRTAKWLDFLLSGFFVGGAMYIYLTDRFTPIVIGLFLVVEAVLAWRIKRPALLWQYWPKLAGLGGIALLIFIPFGLFFAQNPAAFVERAGTVSIFNPTMNHGDFGGTLWQTVLTTLGTFIALTGDPNSLANIPGKPELSPLLAFFFILGWGMVGQAFYLSKDNSPYLFLLIWWPTMLLPAILAPEGAPHHLRLIGTAPATYILVGLGICQAIKKLNQAKYRSYLLVGLIFGLTASQTYHDYFIRWANEVNHDMDFDLYIKTLVQQMSAENDPTLAYIIPMDLRAAQEARHYSLDFLYRGKTPFSYIVVDEATVSASLRQAAHGKNRLKVVRWTADKHHEADAKEMISYLLATNTQFVKRDSFAVYDVETYHLNQKADFTLPTINQPLAFTFEGVLRLDAVFVPPTALPGQLLPVALTFAPLSKMNTDYKASLRLINAAGQRIAQKDRQLLHNYHQGTSLWPPETVNEYYLLAVPPQIPSGQYTVTVVIYHPKSLAPLMAAGLAELPIGAVQLTP